MRSCIPCRTGIRRRRPLPEPATFRRGRRILKQWVLVLKPGASWKEVDPTSNHMPISRPGLSINGRIYYLALTNTPNYVVVNFDIESEKFENIQAPGVHTRLKKVSLTEYDGEVVLWVLKEDGNKKWSKKTLDLQPSQIHLVHNLHFEIDINGIPDHWFDTIAANECFSLMYMDQSESILYLGDLN
ncbi:hypothetical protein Bca52824_032773 [Brassica carinata]|uniref:F-box associated beta-propeller type 3 domain-containing protein n=1 Tax=Brassica carinata TaxID=52824 RepID=A0A8X7SDP8_BRACI|nr:hypothetical protein Bca52824_032773 [Brassica carinata]